jgi:CheY-like chemotaxis protein
MDTGVVLIADNDVAVNELLAQILTDRGLRCESVLDGGEALARLRDGGVCVLVTDLDMPNLDGRALLRHLPELPQAPATVVISGYVDQRLAAELESTPLVRAVLAKPFDVLAFADLVAGLVGEVTGGR